MPTLSLLGHRSDLGTRFPDVPRWPGTDQVCQSGNDNQETLGVKSPFKRDQAIRMFSGDRHLLITAFQKKCFIFRTEC